MRHLILITKIFLVTYLLGLHQMALGDNHGNSRHPDRFMDVDGLELLYPGNWLNSRGAVLLVLSDEGDFLAGTSSFKDRAVAQLFKVEKPYYLHGAWFWLGERLGESGFIEFKVWHLNGSQSRVITSVQVPCKRISAGQSQNDMFLVMFDSQLYVDNDFLIGMDLTIAGDTRLGMLSTRDGDGMGSGLFWKQGSDGTWRSMLAGDPVRADLDLAIFPLIKRPVESATTIQDRITLSDPSSCFSDGTGSRSNPFQVATPHQLDCIRYFTWAHFIQVADIDLNVSPWNRGEGWNPIGDQGNPFTGSFHGNGHVIENLFIDRPLSNCTGLFSESERAEFSHMTLRAINVNGNDYVGGLVGLATESTFNRISISGNIVGQGKHTGRLFGYQSKATDRVAVPVTDRIDRFAREDQIQDETVFPSDKTEPVFSFPATEKGIDQVPEEINPAEAVAEDNTPKATIAKDAIVGEGVVETVVADTATFETGIIGDAISEDGVDSLAENQLPDEPLLMKDRSADFYDSDNQIFVGNIVWMGKNLDVDTGTNWYPQYRYIIDGSWQWVTHAEYGRFYDWETALIACPAPWRLPDDDEWQQLIDYFGGNESAGGLLKDDKKAGTGHESHPKWHQPNTGATNQSGFGAFPAGFNNGNDTFSEIGRIGGWWTSTEATPVVAWSRTMYHNSTTVGRFNYPKTYGLSVRCVRDAD